jgi:Transcriptional regulator
MRKGDLMRERICKTAEELFFTKGYDHTSVQDILDVLELSKGGFYHYYPSKDAILTEICERRTAQRLEKAGVELFSQRMRPTDRISVLLKQVSLLEAATPEAAALMLKICYKDEDVRIRVRVQDIVCEKLNAPLIEVLNAGHRSEDFFVRDAVHTAEILLRMVTAAYDGMCRTLSQSLDNADAVLDVLDTLNAVRDAVETLIGAKHGSVALMEPTAFVTAYREASKALEALGE